jgi:hypothetical protein
MPKAVQFSVALDNSAGTLAALCNRLKKARVNLAAISVSDNTDSGWVRLIATPSTKARTVLEKAGYTVCATLVVSLDLPNRPGELERIASRLARAGINIHYVYGSTSSSNSSTLILGVSDVAKALKALNPT